MPTKVIHIRDSSTYFKDLIVYIGRPSIYGNPFRIGPDGNREEVIHKFHAYFLDRIGKDNDFRLAVLKLQDKILTCYCKPAACHGDVYVNFLANIGSDG